MRACLSAHIVEPRSLAKQHARCLAVLHMYLRKIPRTPSVSRHWVRVMSSCLATLKFDMSKTKTARICRTWTHVAQDDWVPRPVWVVASTREGEEALVLQASTTLEIKNTLLILVPRHPQRFDAVAELIKRKWLRMVRRSS